jgi:DNA-binding Xre family transcriptional regulator
MLTTRWAKALSKAGRSQASLANALRVNTAEMSWVAQGRMWLTPDKFVRACELLGCKPGDLYEADALALLYGITDGTTKAVAKKPRPHKSQVRLDEDTTELVEAVASDEHLTKTQAANAIIRRAFETRRIEHV